MKVAFIAPELIPAIGGSGTYSVGLVEALAKRQGLEIHVFTPNRKRGERDELELQALKQLAEVHFVSNARDFFLFNLWFQKKLYSVFNKVDRQEHFDLVHAANLAGVPDILLKLGNCKKPTIVTAHSTIETQLLGIKKSSAGLFVLQASERYSLLFFPIIKALQGFYLNRTKNIIAVSEFLKEHMLENNKLSAGTTIDVVHNGVDAEKFSSQNKSREQFLPAGIFGEKAVVLFFGRLLASKGIQTLLDAAPAVLTSCENAFFVFAGSGNSDYWKKKAQEKGIEKQCLFLERLPYGSVPFLLNEASIVVLPSFSESFPLTLLEAMSCAKPIIASNVGGIPELVSDNFNGLLFEAGNTKMLAEKIVWLAQEKEKARRIAKNARQTVLKNFTVEKMASETFLVYEKALS